MSVVAHELSHGYAADFLGDPTARLAGRLTPNPIKHLEPFGSFILPMMSYFLGGFIFGWAKPVPYNPYNLKTKLAETFVAAAGIITNLALALIFGLLIRFFGGTLPESFVTIATAIVFINLILAVFNAIPVPPLDGSKVLFSILPFRFHRLERILEQWGLFVLIFFVIFLWQYIFPVIAYLFQLIVGVSI